MSRLLPAMALIISLSGCGGRSGVDYTESGVVETLHEDQDPDMRYWAAEALADMDPKPKSAVPELIKALNDKNSMVRMGVAYSLAKFGPQAKEAIPALQKTLRDPEKKVRDAAAYALKKIQKSR